MSSRTSRLVPAGVLAAAATVALAVTAAPAHALTCAPDPFETDALEGPQAPIAVGQSLTRSVCQDATTGVDRDWFVIDAPGGKAYNVAITAAGSALGQVTTAGVLIVNPDGSASSIDSPNTRDGRAFNTPVLPKGRYVFVLLTPEETAGPDFYLQPKTVEGAAGAYTVKLSDNPVGVPSVTGLSVPKLKGNTISTGSFTLSGPAPAGGMYVDFRHSGVPYISIGRVWINGGARSGSVSINVGRVAKDATATISAFTPVGNAVTVTTPVKKG